MQERTDLQGFTLMGMLSAAPSVPEGLEAAAAALRVLTSAEKGAAAAWCAAVVRSFDDDLHEAVRRSSPSIAGSVDEDRLPSGSLSWRRWISTVRSASAAVSEAYRLLFVEDDAVPSGELRLKAAIRLSESIKWGLIDRCRPDSVQWADWATFRVSEGALPTVADVMHRDDIEREYLVALAYHAAALDQLSLPCALTTSRLIRLSLPFLSISPRWVSGTLYQVKGPHAPVPVRVVERPGDDEGVCFFVSDAALEFLDVCASRLLAGDVPGPLAGSDRQLSLDAIAHLRSLWTSDSRRRQNRRHDVDGVIEVACGWPESLAFLSLAAVVRSEEWRVLDVSRSGVRVAVRVRRDGGIPEVGRLVCFQFVDGSTRQVGVVRRVRTADASCAEVGIETLSVAPARVRADDGQQAIDVLLCDALSHGEAVRVMGASHALRVDVPLYLVQGGKVWKLRSMEFCIRGEGFDLRVYQVL